MRAIRVCELGGFLCRSVALREDLALRYLGFFWELA
jgi:hypothetical protein